MIELDGTVSNVVNVDSDLPDRYRVTCLTATYEDAELTFPQPEAGRSPSSCRWNCHRVFAGVAQLSSSSGFLP